MMNKLDGSDQSSSTSITSCISSSSVSFTSSEKVKQSTSQLIVQPGVTQNTVNSSVKSHSSPVVSQPSSSTLSSADILLNIEDFSSNLSSPLQQSTKTSSNTEETQLGDLKPSGQFMELQAIHPVIKSFLIGSVSGTCSTVLFQPLDLLKTRLQTPNIRHAAGATPLSGGGIISVVGHIVRHERLFGLWRGITPSLTRCVPGVGLYFATIHGLKQTFDIHGEPTALQSLMLGVTGRSFSGVMMIPFTVIKTRFESKVYNYNSIREAFRSIYRLEGVRGLTCGLLPTLLRDAPFSGIYLLIYSSTKKGVGKEWMESPALGPYVRFSCGVVAGIGASLITQPADVLKTKMQLYPERFQSLRQVVPYVYAKYGLVGYFKGLMPRMIRRTLIAAMSWTVYEQLIHNMGLK